MILLLHKPIIDIIHHYDNYVFKTQGIEITSWDVITLFYFIEMFKRLLSVV